MPFADKPLELKLRQILDGIVSGENVMKIVNGNYKIDKTTIDKVSAAALNDAITSDSVSLSFLGEFFNRRAMVALKKLIEEKKKWAVALWHLQ